MSALGQVTSEKGNPDAAAPNWPNRSLFNLIDRALRPRSRARPLGEPFAALVCDDLGDEVADFIAIDEASGGETPRAAFVVAKHKARAGGVSASALYDVCSQAAKNLAYLKADATDLPGTPGKWNGDWKSGGGRVPRIRAGPKAAALRSMFSRVRANPSARRSVWLGTCRSLTFCSWFTSCSPSTPLASQSVWTSASSARISPAAAMGLRCALRQRPREPEQPATCWQSG